MDTTDFDVEFYNKVSNINDDALSKEAVNRLNALTKGHKDLTGASVALEELSHGETAYLYQARVVIYKRPENLAAVEKQATLEGALKGALDALEFQVRKDREKRQEAHHNHHGEAEDLTVYKLTPREAYETYGNGAALADLANLDRTSIARDLMEREGLDPRSAHFAADQLLHHAQETLA